MRNQIIALARLPAQLRHVRHTKRDVFQSEFLGEVRRPRDRQFRQVDADKLRVGELHRHRNQMGSVITPHLKHAARMDIRCLDSEQYAQSSHPADMRLRERRAVVQNLVIRVLHCSSRIFSCVRACIEMKPAVHQLRDLCGKQRFSFRRGLQLR
jgi:hypothetical protein